MAIIPLRAYNREIEGLIDNNQLDEAIAHCRHILSTFPKHIATYRLMGKAHLEQQRISDATDLFQRVLSAVPDDFISNVGMSIIREDENNLDAAIWHMELAYEAQPSNVAIQDELRRLYGRRDGIQPPKVRLTRGALAKMYAKGGLYDQAVAELRGAINEDPNRPDLQLLLAQMYFQISQRVEAVETCVNILKKLPLCLAANQIMAVCLPQAEKNEAGKNFRQVAVSMDPYFAFASLDAISSDQVPENSVTLEKFDWKPGIKAAEQPPQPAWATSLGITLDKPTEEKLPEWLKVAESPMAATPADNTQPNVSPFIWDTQEVQKIITDASSPEEEIPEWMKDAGWQPATEDTLQKEKEASVQPQVAPEPASEELAEAEIPDWLRGIAPEGALDPNAPFPEEDKETLLPWLEKQQPGPTDTIIQWLETKEPDKPAIPSVLDATQVDAFTEEVPDWLKDLDEVYPSEKETEKPSGDILKIAAVTPAFIDETFFNEPEMEKPAEIPAIESAGQLETPPTAEVASLQTEPEVPSEVPAPSEEIPDWIKELAGEMPSSEADKTTAEPTEPELSAFFEEETKSTLPGLAEVAPVAAATAFIEEPPPPASEEAEKPASEPGISAGEALGLAFIGGLAGHHAAQEEDEGQAEPGKQPEESTPDLVKLGAEAAVVKSVVEDEPTLEQPAPIPTEEIPDWIKGLGEVTEEEQAPVEQIAATPSEAEIPKAEELPDWLKEIEEPEAEVETSAPVPEALEWKEEELPDWIKELSETPEAEAPVTSPEPPTIELAPVAAAEAASVVAPEEQQVAEIEDEQPIKPLPAALAWVAATEIMDEQDQPVATEAEVAPVAEAASVVAEVTTEVPVSMPPEVQPEAAVVEVPAAEEVDLEDARKAIDEGNSKQAIAVYSSLIKQKKQLPEVIKHLQEAIYRFPVDAKLWVTLGDAYSGTDDLQNALDTYTKAEELVR